MQRYGSATYSTADSPSTRRFSQRELSGTRIESEESQIPFTQMLHCRHRYHLEWHRRTRNFYSQGAFSSLLHPLSNDISHEYYEIINNVERVYERSQSHYRQSIFTFLMVDDSRCSVATNDSSRVPHRDSAKGKIYVFAN